MESVRIEGLGDFLMTRQADGRLALVSRVPGASPGRPGGQTGQPVSALFPTPMAPLTMQESAMLNVGQ